MPVYLILLLLLYVNRWLAEDNAFEYYKDKKGMKCPSKIAKTHVKESIPLIPEGGLRAPAEKSSY